jgi:hypothetical protein
MVEVAFAQQTNRRTLFFEWFSKFKGSDLCRRYQMPRIHISGKNVRKHGSNEGTSPWTTE